jgi:hypothetical protein
VWENIFEVAPVVVQPVLSNPLAPVTKTLTGLLGGGL